MLQVQQEKTTAEDEDDEVQETVKKKVEYEVSETGHSDLIF